MCSEGRDRGGEASRAHLPSVCYFLTPAYLSASFSSDNTRCFELPLQIIYFVFVFRDKRLMGTAYAYNPFSRQNSESE